MANDLSVVNISKNKLNRNAVDNLVNLKNLVDNISNSNGNKIVQDEQQLEQLDAGNHFENSNVLAKHLNKNLNKFESTDHDPQACSVKVDGNLKLELN